MTKKDESLNKLPKGFVYVKKIIPNICVDLRYYGTNNFIGTRIEGYKKNECILTKKAACALKDVQTELNQHDLGLKIFDTYRPLKAVKFIKEWSKADIDRQNLFREGYIAEKSGHSRGSTIDLTIICLNDCSGNKNNELDMGGDFDLFAKSSWSSCTEITPQNRSNRLLLRLIMEKYGFESLEKEWWHFTLKNEPFPDTYFDFDIQ